MVKTMLMRLGRYLAFRFGVGTAFYKRICRPGGEEWGALLKSRHTFYGMGEHCSIQTNVSITDPKYVRLGNNVRLSGCTIFGHDGAVNMLNHAYGLNLDRVGKVEILDNVFIGHGAIVLPGATIGPNTIVAAGAVLTGDAEANSVYGGVPARRIGSIDDVVGRMQREHASYPWQHLIAARGPRFDPAIQPQLDLLRSRHFFEAPGQQKPGNEPATIRPLSSAVSAFRAAETATQSPLI